MYREQELLFPAKLIQSGYTHKFQVLVNGVELFFEPDEEMKYRALADTETVVKDLDASLLLAIANSIEAIVS